MMDVMFFLSLINCLSANLSYFILLQDALRKNDGKLPFHKFSTDDIGIIKTTDERMKRALIIRENFTIGAIITSE
jgi:hypothetical protein